MGNINKVITPFNLGTCKRPKLTDISQKTKRACWWVQSLHLRKSGYHLGSDWKRDKANVIRKKGRKDAMSNDRHRGKNNRNDEIRKRIISKNWTEVNVCPCEKWASGWHNDRRTGYVQHSGSSHWKSYWSEELLQTYQVFSEDHLEIKWKASYE